MSPQARQSTLQSVNRANTMASWHLCSSSWSAYEMLGGSSLPITRNCGHAQCPLAKLKSLWCQHTALPVSHRAPSIIEFALACRDTHNRDCRVCISAVRRGSAAIHVASQARCTLPSSSLLVQSHKLEAGYMKSAALERPRARNKSKQEEWNADQSKRTAGSSALSSTMMEHGTSAKRRRTDENACRLASRTETSHMSFT